MIIWYRLISAYAFPALRDRAIGKHCVELAAKKQFVLVTIAVNKETEVFLDLHPQLLLF